MKDEKMKYVFVISGPSGVGKSTLINHVLNNFKKAMLSVSCTTRLPRKLESHGKDYYFISQDEFKNHINKRDFVEYTYCFNNNYGTLKSEIYRILDNTDICILDIEFVGAFNILEKKVINYPEKVKYIGILILPPSLYALKQRLIRRGTETENNIKLRLKSFNDYQIHYYESMYSYLIINSDIQKSQNIILKIIQKELNNN